MTNWTVGMKVMFGRTNGEKTLGVIVKVNPKKLKVEQLEQRGVQKNHSVGTVWTVPRSLCTPVLTHTGLKGVGKTLTSVKIELPPKTELELMREISGCYNGLSPENLSCDGEASITSIRRRGAALRRQLREAEKQLGRKVSEWDCYTWLRDNTETGW